jgi:hypothetical protein
MEPMKLLLKKIFGQNRLKKDRLKKGGEGPWPNDQYHELYLPNTI